MDHTSRLDLPFIMGGQALKHITHNEALQRLDALVQPVVESAAVTTPPTTPLPGEAYLVPAGASGAGRMALVNHFRDVDIFGISIPDRFEAAQTNSVQGTNSIGAQASACVQAFGRWPNCVLVDWFDRGDVFGAQRMMNGL